MERYINIGLVLLCCSRVTFLSVYQFVPLTSADGKADFGV